VAEEHITYAKSDVAHVVTVQLQSFAAITGKEKLYNA
jgi:hypothetical protein